MKQTAVLLLAISALMFCAMGAEQKTQEKEVKIDNFSFAPQVLKISPGTKVTWINKDDVPHTVVSVEKKFKSSPLDTGDKFSFTFSAPGTYEYFCSIHAHMKGKVVVQ